MNAKKLVVGLVTAVTLTLFMGAAYAQQMAVTQGSDAAQASSTNDAAQVSSAHQEEHGGTHEHHAHEHHWHA